MSTLQLFVGAVGQDAVSGPTQLQSLSLSARLSVRCCCLSMSSWPRPAERPRLSCLLVMSDAPARSMNGMSSRRHDERNKLTICPTGAADQPNATKDIDLPARHVANEAPTHELVSTEEFQEGTKMQAHLPPRTGVWTMSTPLWPDNRPHPGTTRPQKALHETKNPRESAPRSCHQHNP